MAGAKGATTKEEKPKTPATPAPAADATAAKSIINPKYRDKYKGKEKDWLAKFIDEHATATKTVKYTEMDGDTKVNKTKTVSDGVDVDKLHALAEKNGLDITALKAQSDTHGYPGRARMTIRNMLQTVAKQRHGLHNTGGTFVSAPKDFLAAKGAPDAPTHTQKGEKIAKPAKADDKKAPDADKAK